MASYKLIFTFPPEFDGELHVFVGEKVTGPAKHLKVKLIINQEEHETIIKTIRELGQILAKNPVYMQQLGDKEAETSAN